MATRVLVSPAFRKPSYYTYYLQGLFDVFGRQAVRFTLADFPPVYEHGLCVTLLEPQTKVFMSASDGMGVNQLLYDWCDVYAKINVPLSSTLEKILPIGPSFGLRCWSRSSTVVNALKNYAATYRIAKPDLKEHFGHYRAQYRRPLESAYVPGRARSDYVFYASSLWKKEPLTNKYRAAFVETVQAFSDIEFEGGFAPRSDVLGYDHLFMPQRLTAKDYISKTKASAVVFNTPAVRSCLGWKLGEFLALGKAIISTPLGRQMPAPLEDGTHIHFVDGTRESIAAAVERLIGEPTYRRRLEENARRYYERYLQPSAVIQRVVSAAKMRRDLVS